jgi:hypothetical protein
LERVPLVGSSASDLYDFRNGTIYHSTDHGQTWPNSLTTTEPWVAVGLSSTTDVWATGDANIWHSTGNDQFAGATFPSSSPITTQGILVNSPTDVYIVGHRLAPTLHGVDGVLIHGQGASVH